MPIKIKTWEPLPPTTKPQPVRLPPRKPPKKAPPATNWVDALAKSWERRADEWMNAKDFVGDDEYLGECFAVMYKEMARDLRACAGKQ